MGRIVRGVLRTASRNGVAVTLLLADREDFSGDPDADMLGALGRAPLSSARSKNRYDATWYPWNGIRFPSASRCLVHIHDTFALHEPGLGWIARIRVRAPLLRAARRADRIATDSAWSAAQIERELNVDASRIVVIRLSPDPLFSPADRTEQVQRLPPTPFVLVVGAGEARKNAPFLVRAFAAAFPAREATLVVAGSLSGEALREAAALEVPIVRETPDDARLRELYRAAACVAVPSLSEGFGLVVVEAQACGAPVIASNSSALPEAAGDAAVLLPSDDAGAWQRALREVVFDRALASRLRALGVSRWNGADREAPARAILAVLRDLAAQSA